MIFEESEEYTRAPINAASLKSFEKRKLITFPEPLRSALLKVNGGDFEWNVFKRGDDLYIIHGFYGLVPKGEKGWPRLRTITEDAGSFDTERVGDPEKIYLFHQEFPLDWYWALNFNTSATDPSIWIIEDDSGSPSRQVFKNWKELESCRYYGDEISSVDFEKWSDGKVLVDHHGGASTLRQRMVLQNGTICLQRESVYSEGEINRSESCFKLGAVNRESLLMQHDREEEPQIRLTFSAPFVSSANSKLMGERWMNGKRYLNPVTGPDTDVVLFHSFEPAIKVFRMLAGAG